MKLIADAHLAMLDWSVEQYCEGNMIGQVEITRKQEPTFDPDTGFVSPADSVVIYTGKARISDLSGPMTYSLGDEPQYFSGGTIYIPEDASPAPQIDDVVVTAHPEKSVIGRAYRVTDVSAGGQLSGAKRLQVTGVQPARNA